MDDRGGFETHETCGKLELFRASSATAQPRARAAAHARVSAAKSSAGPLELCGETRKSPSAVHRAGCATPARVSGTAAGRPAGCIHGHSRDNSATTMKSVSFSRWVVVY